jgi:hypothetical protein
MLLHSVPPLFDVLNRMFVESGKFHLDGVRSETMRIELHADGLLASLECAIELPVNLVRCFILLLLSLLLAVYLGGVVVSHSFPRFGR